MTQAAKQLNMSHLAVSHQVRVLDGWSATALFACSGCTIILTKARLSLAITANSTFDEVCHEMIVFACAGSTRHHRDFTLGCEQSDHAPFAVPNLIGSVYLVARLTDAVSHLNQELYRKV